MFDFYKNLIDFAQRLSIPFRLERRIFICQSGNNIDIGRKFSRQLHAKSGSERKIVVAADCKTSNQRTALLKSGSEHIFAPGGGRGNKQRPLLPGRFFPDSDLM